MSQTIDMNNVNSATFNNSTVNEIYLNSTKIWPIISTVEPYLTFSANDSFALKTSTGGRNWDGILEYSTDKTTWTTWDGVGNGISAAYNGIEYVLYLRGTGNTVISSNVNDFRFQFTGDNLYKKISGNIEVLLDYATVVNGQHPPMAERCFQSLFQNAISIKDCSDLILGAETASGHCYQSMFRGCINLEYSPRILLTTLKEYCLYGMFRDCSSLKQLVALPALLVKREVYSYMYYNCPRIKMSSTQIDEYQNAYRIPTTGTGASTVGASGFANNMFSATGGSFKSQPLLNTTYYTSNAIIMPDGTIIPAVQ